MRVQIPPSVPGFGLLPHSVCAVEIAATGGCVRLGLTNQLFDPRFSDHLVPLISGISGVALAQVLLVVDLLTQGLPPANLLSRPP